MEHKITTTLRHSAVYFAFTFLTTVLFSSRTFSQAPSWLWGKSIAGTQNDISNSIAVDAAGNVYTTGTFSGTNTDFDPGPAGFTLFAYSAEDIFVSKLDAAGNFVWAVTIGGLVNDNGNAIAADAAGNVYITGVFAHTVDFDPSPSAAFNLVSDNFSNDIFVCKLNSAGNFVWAKALGGPGNDIGYSLAVDALGNVLVTGAFSGTGDFDPGTGTFNLTTAGYNDLFISKLDGAGNFVWAKGMGGAATYAWGQGIAVDVSGNVVATGVFGTTVDFDPGAGTFNLTAVSGYDVFVCRLDNSGNFSWAKGFGGISMDAGNSIAVDASGNIYTCGLFLATVDFDPGAGTFPITSAGNGDAFASKLNSSGDFVWAKAMGGTDAEEARALTVDASGNVYITGIFSATADFDPGAGTFNLTATAGDIFLSKLDASGNFGWAMQAGGDLTDIGTSVALSTAGNLHIAGYFFSHFLTVTAPLPNADTSATTNDVVIAKTGAMVTGNDEAENYGNTISLFPNPVTNEFTIYDVRFTISEIEIYNTLGEKIFSRLMTNDQSPITISVANFDVGIYFVRIKTSEGISTGKFVKE